MVKIQYFTPDELAQALKAWREYKDANGSISSPEKLREALAAVLMAAAQSRLANSGLKVHGGKL